MKIDVLSRIFLSDSQRKVIMRKQLFLTQDVMQSSNSENFIEFQITCVVTLANCMLTFKNVSVDVTETLAVDFF